MKINHGVTLLEIVIALAILAIFALSVSGIYLSGWRLFRDAQYRAEAQAAAQAAMAYMVKNLQNTANIFWVENITGQQYALYAQNYTEGSPEFGQLPPNIQRYHWDGNNLIYTNYTGWASQDTAIIGKYITEFAPVTTHESTVVEINITAEDSRGENPFELFSRIHARGTAAPSVYESQTGP